ncbi:hypothetical protein PMAYCL1PPCAC_13532, partial [Pristionchus mayeri]
SIHSFPFLRSRAVLPPRNGHRHAALLRWRLLRWFRWRIPLRRIRSVRWWSGDRRAGVRLRVLRRILALLRRGILRQGILRGRLLFAGRGGVLRLLHRQRPLL